MGVTAVRLLSSLGLLVIIVQAQDCSRPVGGANMDLKGDDILLTVFPDGTKVTFACNVGYVSQGGSPTITCTKGSWSTVRLICGRFNCGAAQDVEYGHVDYQPGTEFGDKAVIVCNTGYLPVGKGTLTCGAQGWEGRLPVCEVIRCDSPPPVVDGSFYPDKQTYDYNEVVQYSCKSGYTANGTRQLACSDDGTFKPNPPKCVMVDCEEPVIPNGFRTTRGPPYGHLSTVTFECNAGYTMSGNPMQTCNINSKWEPGLPKCTGHCQDPKEISPKVTVSRGPPYKWSDQVTVSCPSGDEQDRKSVTCRENGLWDPEIPKCHADVLKAVLITLAVIAVVAIVLFGMRHFGVRPFKKNSKGPRRGKEATKEGEDVALS